MRRQPHRRLDHGHALYAVLALAIGIAAGVIFSPQVPDVIQPYLPIAVVAALDTVFGGLRAYLDDIFDAQTFVVSFVFNVLVAALIVWLGDQLGVGTQLSTAVIVVLGIRIFGNASALRRRLFGA
ncbi:small basic family protein [Rhodococcus phenolicus]|uniref:small basic family protein n=1 Tax=Rhodococcus phenolicus TaxID=263849 RepID=UPI00082E2889|nr:small basic family protein [Rhodococcus phenolicus]